MSERSSVFDMIGSPNLHIVGVGRIGRTVGHILENIREW